jgi:hypothetical protein
MMVYQADSKDFEIYYFPGKAFLFSPPPGVGLFYLIRVDSLLQPVPKTFSTLQIDKQSI